MNKILVTGGCGFLGSNIASSYLRNGWEVVIIDMLFRQGGESNKNWLDEQAEEGQLHFYQYDLADNAYVEEVFKNHSPFDYICHLGGQVAMTTSLSDPRRDIITNIIGSFNILEATRKYSPGALVAYSSTNKVYGDLEWIESTENETRFIPKGYENGFDESLPLDFASPYGCSKGGADQYMRDWYRNYGVDTVVFRHSSIYGGRQFSTFDQGWVGWFCKQAIEQKCASDEGRELPPFTIAGKGKQVRDVLHADDLISLYKRVYEKRELVSGQIFNIGGGLQNSLSLLELFTMLEDKVGVNLHYEKLARRQSDQDFFVADISKAKSIIGWSPTVSKEHGIEKMINWVSENG